MRAIPYRELLWRAFAIFGPLGKAIIIGGNPEHCFPRRHVCHLLGNGARFFGALTPMFGIIETTDSGKGGMYP
jgi:hypothetical protein